MVVSDLCLLGVFGIELIKFVEGILVLIMISYVSLCLVVDLMKMGVVDYIVKFFDYDEMFQVVVCIFKDCQENCSVVLVFVNGGKVGGECGVSLVVVDGEIGIIGFCVLM